jgi:hypothetical protein
MRLIITGKSRSGKSTALHRIIRTALQATWATILIADGKSVELTRYATVDLRVYGEADAEAFAAALAANAARLTLRYQALVARGFTAAIPGDPRELIIIDEVQAFSRNPKVGKAIRDTLTDIFERSAALGDVVIVASQRATGAVPPSVRVNANVQLRLLGSGYFQFVADDHPTRQGRVDLLAPLACSSLLTPEGLPLALSAQTVTKALTPITRYEGALGSGRTFALAHHLSDPAYRRVYLDIKSYSHRALLVHCLRSCGATPPEAAPIAELAEAAALALQARPTLLLLDNCEHATVKMVTSLHTLLDTATVAAIAMTPPATADHTKDPLAALRRRATLIPIQPLDGQRAAALLEQVAPNIDQASKVAILQQAQGHPQTIMAYAERVATHGDEERHALDPVKPPARWLNVLLMFSVLVVIIMIQRQIANDLAGAVLSGVVVMTMWFLRPRFREVTKK